MLLYGNVDCGANTDGGTDASVFCQISLVDELPSLMAYEDLLTASLVCSGLYPSRMT